MYGKRMLIQTIDRQLTKLPEVHIGYLQGGVCMEGGLPLANVRVVCHNKSIKTSCQNRGSSLLFIRLRQLKVFLKQLSSLCCVAVIILFTSRKGSYVNITHFRGGEGGESRSALCNNCYLLLFKKIQNEVLNLFLLKSLYNIYINLLNKIGKSREGWCVTQNRKKLI